MELKATRCQVDGGVAVCTFNRPHRFNAMTNRMMTEYRWALRTADRDPDVRVVVVTGAGRAFCPGADTEALGQVAGGRPYQDPPPLDPDPEGEGEPGSEPQATTGPFGPETPDFDHLLTAPLGMAKPVIAAINGPVAGVGFSLMCFCDRRFATAEAKITTSFARLGLPAEHGVSWILPRLIGPARAADLLLSSRVVLAEEALALGLVNRVYPAADLMSETLRYGRAIAAETAPSSTRVIKAQLNADLLGHLDASARRSVELMHERLGSPDFKEGVAALREKRPPRFAPG